MHRLACIAAFSGALAACATSAQPGHAAATPPSAEEQAVIDAVDRMFTAMRTHDVEGLRAAVMEGASIVRVGTDDQGQTRHGIVSDADFVDGTAGDTGMEIDERFTSTPAVRIDGPMASLWGPYEVYVDGERKHCGVDAVQLAHLDGSWRVASIVYTARPCN